MNVLVTGGAGYVGSHVCRDLLRAGHSVGILDDLSRGHMWTVERLQELARGPSRVVLHRADVCDEQVVAAILRATTVDAVVHCAGVAYVGESVADPLRYYRINAAGTLSVLRACSRARVGRFLLSSSCATYGDPDGDVPLVAEDAPQRPLSPYGWSKLIAERMVLDFAAAPGNEQFRAGVLRYFNVAGCDRAGVFGHDFHPETRVIPLCIMAALGVGGAAPFKVLGDDYPTPDGTAVRDYIHPDDLAGAHLRVLEAICASRSPGMTPTPVYNLGSGRGVSVRQIISAVERVVGRRVPVEVAPRRAGDAVALVCDPSRIERDLGWKTHCSSLDEIVATAANWIGKRREA